MVKRRTKQRTSEPGELEAESDVDLSTGDDVRGGMDVNAVVSYNLKQIREKRGMTQEDVAFALAQLTGRLLPQASISAMERSYESSRRKRFDAHELYLLSMVFSVPIVYFFLPPDHTYRELADTHRPMDELYVSLLGREDQLDVFDERLAELHLRSPEDVDPIMAAIHGSKDVATRNWHDHYRTWRKKRVAELSRSYGDQLNEVADILHQFSSSILHLGVDGYLQSLVYRDGEDLDPPILTEDEEAKEA